MVAVGLIVLTSQIARCAHLLRPFHRHGLVDAGPNADHEAGRQSKVSVLLERQRNIVECADQAKVRERCGAIVQGDLEGSGRG